MRKLKLAAFVLVGLCFLQGNSFAGVVRYTDRASFTALGSIAYNSNFRDFGLFTSFPSSTSTPFTRGDVSYNSPLLNLVWGPSSGLTTTEQLIGNNDYTPFPGSIAQTPRYTMFGFDIAMFGPSTVTISVTTNTGTYTYPGLPVANSMNGILSFEGFTTSSLGEYFTSFIITADAGRTGFLPGITNVTLGNAGNGSSVPEPSTIALFSLGLAIAASGKRRKPA